jgi:Carboxypeptidase regulatory-like domain/TonB-dependent Receptor Plug Domain
MPALVLVLLLMICSAAVAQVINGSITGEVRDASGAYIPKATVTVLDATIGVHQVTTTDSRGSFYFPSLPKGTYTITVASHGFMHLDMTGIPLSNGDHLNAGAFTLGVGGANETVTVVADAGELQVQTQSGERSDTITTGQLNDLGMNGRMVLDYLKVIPGVSSTFNGAQSSKGGLGDISVNGGRKGMTGFTVDGINNVDNGCNCATQITVNPDAIAEVKVITSNYQAEYGKTGAGMISVTTKGGDNQFHGNLRWFHRNEGLNANQWFDNQANALHKAADPTSTTVPNPKQLYRYNYFGGQVGGPIVIPGTSFNKHRDKLFFFFSEEVYRQLLPGGFDNVYVPTAAEINGDFSKSTDGNGKPVVIKDPAGNPYPGNQLPAGLINKGMQGALLNVYPRAIPGDADPTNNCPVTPQNLTGQCNRYNYITNNTTTHPRREDIGRIDYQINNSNRAYYSLANNAGSQHLPEGLSPQGISNFQFPGGMQLNEPGYSTVLHVTSTITPTMINDLSFGWSINKQQITSINNNVLASKYGLNIPLVYPVSADTPIPDFSFGGLPNQTGTWSYLGSLPWRNAATVIDFNDNLSKMLGKHLLKAGILVERSRKDQSSWGNANGSFGFQTGASTLPASLDTGDPYANALLGNYSSFQQQNGRPRGYYRYTNIEFYLQDNYKLTRRLTLDYGMRFAWVQPQYDAQNQVSYFDPAAWNSSQAVRLYKTQPNNTSHGYDTVTGAIVPQNMIGNVVPGSGNPYNGMVSAKTGGLAGGYKDRGLMPEPRFGFAYDLLGNAKYVVRGGMGISHDRFQGNPIYNLAVKNLNGVDPTFSGGSLVDIPSLAAAAPMAPINAFGFDKTGKVPTIYSYSLGVQADIGWKTVLDVAYVGNQQRHLSQKHNLNAIPYGTTFTEAAQDPSNSNYNGVVSPESGWIGSAWTSQGFQYMGDRVFPSNFLRPYMGYSDIEYWTWDGTGNYNSLQIAAHRRFGNSLTFGAAYTYSKTMVTSSSDGAWTNILPNGRRFNYTLASFDRPQNLVINYVYSLPKFSRMMGAKSNWVSYLTDGYQWEGLGQFIIGTPGTVGGSYTMPWGASEQPMITGSWTEPPIMVVKSNPTKGNGGNPNSHLNPNAFALPQIGTPSPQSQNYFRNGGTNSVDMSIFKNIPFGGREAQSLQLRVEAFNVFNHPQFWGINSNTGNPNVNGDTNPWDHLFGNWGNWNAGSPIEPNKLRPAGQKGNLGGYFGEYNSGGNARVLQLGVKLYF